MGDYDAAGLRWQSSAILALQEASEAFLVHLFEDAYVFSHRPSHPDTDHAVLVQKPLRYSRETSNHYDT
jgi:Core histone H2A/H2B/H3/H4